VTSVCLSADGRFALSASADRTLRLWELASGHCLHTFEGHTDSVWAVCLSADGHFALSASADRTLRLWELDWELQAHDLADWDERILPYLETFLTLHTPLAAMPPKDSELSETEIVQALSRHGTPSWTEEEFHGLILQLQNAGYGWVRPEGVRREMEKRTQEFPIPLSFPQKTSWFSRLFSRGT
jgi:hypothetical protein